MAINKELLEIEEEEEYTANIDEFTIGSESKVNRFIGRAFPRVAHGGAMGVVFAGVMGVGAVLAGAAAPIVGTVIALGAGTGAAMQVAFSAGVYIDNNAKFKLKKQNIGGVEDAPGIIEDILDSEDFARVCSEQLENSRNSTITYKSKKYSRAKAKKLVKQEEDKVYHKLKYLLEQAEEASQKVNSSMKAEAKDKYWKILARIGLCCQKLATSRKTFNPYKNLIIENGILRGCLLSVTNDNAENAQITRSSKNNDKELATKVYGNIFESVLLKEIKAERQQELDEINVINEENKTKTKLGRDIVVFGKKSEAAKAEEEEIKKDLEYIMEAGALIIAAEGLAETLPAALSKTKKMVETSIENLRQAVKNKNKVDMQKCVQVLYDNFREATRRCQNYCKKMGRDEVFEIYKTKLAKFVDAYKEALYEETRRADKAEEDRDKWKSAYEEQVEQIKELVKQVEDLMWTIYKGKKKSKEREEKLKETETALFAKEAENQELKEERDAAILRAEIAEWTIDDREERFKKGTIAYWISQKITDMKVLVKFAVEELGVEADDAMVVGLNQAIRRGEQILAAKEIRNSSELRDMNEKFGKMREIAYESLLPPDVTEYALKKYKEGLKRAKLL